VDVDIKETLGNEKLVKILLGGENGQLNQFTVKHAEVEVKIVSSSPDRTFSGKINTPLPEGDFRRLKGCEW
jgi:hypothetical protein